MSPKLRHRQAAILAIVPVQRGRIAPYMLDDGGYQWNQWAPDQDAKNLCGLTKDSSNPATDQMLQLAAIPGLIHLRTPAAMGVHCTSVGRQVILNPEKRKVGGSTPPLTTILEQAKHPVPGVFGCWVSIWGHGTSGR